LWFFKCVGLLASQAISDAAKEAAVLLYSPGADTFLEDLTRNVDRVFYFDEGPRASTKLMSKAYPLAQKSQPLALYLNDALPPAYPSSLWQSPL
jgi:hypothetical protein